MYYNKRESKDYKTQKRKETKVMATEKQRRNTARGFKADTVKLASLLKRTGKSTAACSREMGFSDGAVNTALRSGNMSYGMADRLAKFYRIYKEDYEYVEEVKEETVPEEPKTSKIEFVIAEETEQKLKEIIYSAIYEAMKKALSE